VELGGAVERGRLSDRSRISLSVKPCIRPGPAVSSKRSGPLQLFGHRSLHTSSFSLQHIARAVTVAEPTAKAAKTRGPIPSRSRTDVTRLVRYASGCERPQRAHRPELFMRHSGRRIVRSGGA